MRRRLMLAGIVPALLALVFAAVVLRMTQLQSDGDEAFDQARYPEAADTFAAAGGWNPFEDWVSAFDEGAARHADGDLTPAIDLYRLALETVPQAEECTVRINLSLAHEAVGDAAVEDEPENARDAWEAGLRVLREGGCPTDAGGGEAQTRDAGVVEQRLLDKLRDQSEDEEPDGDPEQERRRDRQERREQREEEQRREELEERNEEGRSQRERQEQDRESEGGVAPQW